MRRLVAVLLSILCVFASSLAPVPAAANDEPYQTYWWPLIPRADVPVQVWFHAKTSIGETAGLEYRINGRSTKLLATPAPDTDNRPIWTATIPKQPTGTKVSYRFFIRDIRGTYLTFTDYKWGYEVLPPGNISHEHLHHNTRMTDYVEPTGPLTAATLGEHAIRLRTKNGDADSVDLVLYEYDPLQSKFKDPVYRKMEWSPFGNSPDSPYQYWEIRTSRLPESGTIWKYKFKITSGTDVDWYSDDTLGPDDDVRKGGPGKAYEDEPESTFQLPIHNWPILNPNWLREAVVYHIALDRFRNGDPENDVCPSGCPGSGVTTHSNWNEAMVPQASGQEYYGGDIAGVIQKLDYLQSLGVNTLYLSGILSSKTYHGDSSDSYTWIDSNVGGEEALKRLQDELASRDMRLLIDFPVYDFREDVEHYPPNTVLLRLREKGIKHFVFRKVDRRSNGFWRSTRTLMKYRFPYGALVADVKGDATDYLLGDQFDSTMNHRVRKAIIGLVRGPSWPHTSDGIPGLTETEFMTAIRAIRADYPDSTNSVMFNFLSSPATGRILSALKKPGEKDWEKAKARLRIATALMFASDGAPVLYYGDEAGMRNADVPDPESVGRQAHAPYPWPDKSGDATVYGPADKSLIDFHSKIASVRNRGIEFPYYSSNFLGTFKNPKSGQTFYLIRSWRGVLIINPEEKPNDLSISFSENKEKTTISDLFGGPAATVTSKQLNVTMPPLSVAYYDPDNPENVPPKVSIEVAPAASEWGWHNGPVKVTAVGTDDHSIASVSLTVDGKTTTARSDRVETTVSGQGIHNISATATDSGGLTTLQPAQTTVKIDLTPPRTRIIPVKIVPTGIRHAKLIFGLVPKDDLSGVNTVSYSINGDGPRDYQGPVTLDTPGTYVVEFFSTDKAGNVEKSNSVTIVLPGRRARNPLPVISGSKPTAPAETPSPAPSSTAVPSPAPQLPSHPTPTAGPSQKPQSRPAHGRSPSRHHREPRSPG